MPFSQRLSTFYHGHRILFGAQRVHGLGFVPLATVTDLCNRAVGETGVHIPIEPFDCEATACQHALLVAMNWIEDRFAMTEARDAFIAIAWISDDDFGALEAMVATAAERRGRTDGPGGGPLVRESGAGTLAAVTKPARLDHEAWLRAALTAERAASEDGQVPVRISIRPAPFARWCEAQQLLPDRIAQGRYAQWLLDGRLI